MNQKIYLLLTITILFGCQQTKSVDNLATKKGMVKVTIFYPNAEGKTFDMNYYEKKHMPLVASLLGDSLKLVTIDKGIAAGTPDASIPYLAIGYLYFEKVSAFQNSFAPHAEKIRADIPNYTNITPIIQISEVLQ